MVCSLVLTIGAAGSLASSQAQEIDTSASPSFASIRNDRVNLRSGPGVTYPIDWVYVRRHLPVELIRSFQDWRRIRDWQGTEGWVHQRQLDGLQTIIVMVDGTLLYEDANETAKPLARMAAGVIGTLKTCSQGWCEIRIEERYKGWVKKSAIWGASQAQPSAAP